jgi:hypothetical protein
VLVAMRQMSTVWEQLFPIEQHRILRLLIERVQLHDDGLEIIWQQDGWREFGRKLGSHALIEEQREPVGAFAVPSLLVSSFCIAATVL